MNKELLDLTNPQKSILYTEQFYNGTAINNICGTAIIKNTLDFEILKEAINIVAKNNASFNLKLVLENNEAKQFLQSFKPLDVEIVDLDSVEGISTLENKLMSHVFDIYSSSNLFEFKIFRFPDRTGGFMLNIHHLFADSWTLGLTAREIVRVYSSLVNNEPINNDNFCSYIDYIYSEKEYLSSDKFKKDKAYWDSVFSTIPEVASIPGSFSDLRSISSCSANRKSFSIDKKDLDRIDNFCKDNKVSIFNFFMAVYSIYIGRVSRLDDFVIGTPILNRINFKEKNTTGMFINTAPLRINIDNTIDFKSFVSNIAKDSLAMLRHQKYYYQSILEDLRYRDSSLPNLYNILISYQVTKANTENGLSYETRWAFNGNTADDIDIHLYDINDTGNIDIAYDYKIVKYSEEDIEAIHNRILHVINQILNNENIYLKDISIVTSKEKYNILYNFNNTDAEYEQYNSIIELIQDTCTKYPNKIAIEFNHDSITYSDLWNRINKLSNYIVSNIDVQTNSNIGILTTRSIDTIIGILAILRVNCTYVPIDPEYPTDRINYMVEKSEINTILLDDINLKNKINNSKINFISINYSYYANNSSTFDCPVTYCKDSNLYIVFTSGSTGNPKGVTISHKNMINLILFEEHNTRIFNDEANHKVLQFATMSFDVSYQEIYSSFLTGSTLVLVDDYTRKDMNLLTKYIVENKVDTLFIPPAYLRLLCEENINIERLSSCIKNIITAGEALIITDGIRKLLKNKIYIHNHYGPAETHVATTYTLDNTYTETSVPIGYPISNSYVYILDSSNNLCPINTIGQIAISGGCVGNGYFNNSDLTDSKFINNPFHANNIIYLTGDLGFWDKSGCIHYIGRSDFQVKVNGFRIELSEIDKVLSSYPGILNCISTIQVINSKKYIVSYYTSNAVFVESNLKDYLKKSLPKFMIPSKIIRLDALPLNNNGKVDRKNLPEFDFTSSMENFVAPSTSTEIKLAEIWKDVFKVDKVGTNYDFFDIGGDSLLAIKLISIINSTFNVDITVADVFNFSVLNNLAEFIDSCNISNSNKSIKKTAKMDYYPLSSAQKRIYYSHKKIGNNTLTYNITGGLLINKILDKDKIVDAVKLLIDRYAIFRTTFTLENDEIKQHIIDDVNINIPVFEDTLDNLDKILNNFQKPFDLERDLLLRFSIYYLDNSKTLLLIDSHHIAVDGVSLNIFIEEFCKLYNNETLDDLQIDYKDFSVWENNFINSHDIKPLEDYWVNKFRDSYLPSINLPYDYVDLNTNNSYGNRISYKMDKTLFKSYENFAKKMNVSSYTLFLSALFILLYKYTSQEELIVGSATVGRENSELYNIVGNFVNNIVIDAKMRNNQSFTDFINYLNSQVLDDLAHQSYPYDLLVKKLSSLNNNYRNSLFDVSFTYQNANTEDYFIDGEIIQILDIYSNTSKFNLLLEIQPKNCMFSFEYNTNLFKKETIQSLLEHYLFILEQVVNNDCIPISDINILTDREIKLLNQFNNTYTATNEDTMVSLFEKEVDNNPDNIALICEDKTLTYRELNKKANSLAHYLIKNGIGTNDIVCIMTNRSFETIICMLGILKSGAAFFNVDPTYPIERTQYYLEDSKTKYVLTQKFLKDKVKSIENCIEIDLDNSDIYNYNFDNPNVKVDKEDLSYIIYTSGSTGTPKGVMLNQVGLANMVKAMTKVLDYLKEGNKHTIVSVTSTPFDIFVYEIVVSLAHGLKVVMANNAEHRNPKLLDALIRKYNVDVMTVTPSLMKINYDNREPDSALALVKNMVFGGEPLPEKFVKDLKALADDITIYNIYGPSEITVLSNVQNLDGEKEITVGPPIMNTQIHILDKNMKRVPIGVVGEIYISGIQVGLGYIGKPEMTAERFIDNPFGEGKIYKSGDVGRWTFDGKVQCLGRVDHQIKLRGLRIELGEIENKMCSVAGVSASVVNKVDLEGKEVLCGYYVADETVSEATIRNTLRDSLPPYMVPTYIMRLDEMPYTVNRKIDRKALPLPSLNKDYDNNSINIRELDSNEEKLLQIWKNILKIDNIDINDNFFDIGGDSISAINMQIEAVKYGLNFEYADIFNYPTIVQLSSKLPSPISSFMKNYDYSKVNEVLKRNTIDNLNTIKKVSTDNILLIGSTGYLGAHIIDEFMKNGSGTIYCLIRPKNNKLPIDRLKEILSFYFKDTYDEQINKRIKVICGDITTENIGLSISDYNLLKNNIDIVINSGAIVKHFGQKDEFENINVNGTQNVVNFCVKENKRLLHISTISISGNGEKEETIEETPENIDNKKLFYETDLFINQNIKGIYTTTKYKAELIVLEAIYNGLNAQILRLGNITNRYSDGLFQFNVENNAFAKRLKSFIEMGAFPKYLLQHAIELTPVDLCANAIFKISQHSSDCNVLHIYNSKLLPIRLLVETLSSLGVNMEAVSDKLLENIIVGILNDDKQKDILSGIIYDLDKNHRLIYTSNVRVKYDFSEKYLNSIGFYWKDIDASYITKYMDYFKKIGFINY